MTGQKPDQKITGRWYGQKPNQRSDAQLSERLKCLSAIKALKILSPTDNGGPIEGSPLSVGLNILKAFPYPGIAGQNWQSYREIPGLNMNKSQNKS